MVSYYHAMLKQSPAPKSPSTFVKTEQDFFKGGVYLTVDGFLGVKIIEFADVIPCCI
jgi:hypothetical protein